MPGRSKILFFDRSVGRSVPAALKTLGLETRYGDDLFAPNEKDDVWMATVGRNGWVLCTQDYSHHKLKNMNEAIAIRQHGIACFYLWGAQAKKWEIMCAFAKGYAAIMRVLEMEKPPFIYQLSRGGATKRIPLP